MYKTRIEYNPTTQLFDLFLNDEDAGTALSYAEGDEILEQLVRELESTGFKEAA